MTTTLQDRRRAGLRFLEMQSPRPGPRLFDEISCHATQSDTPCLSMGDETFVKIACPSCSEHVEFPLAMRGHIINCPHCSLSMVLELPGAAQSPPPANLYQRLRALNNLDAKPVTINPPPGFNQNSQTRP